MLLLFLHVKLGLIQASDVYIFMIHDNESRDITRIFFSLSLTLSLTSKLFMVSEQPWRSAALTNGGSKGFIIKPQSPYYLHPSEGPGTLITAVVFNGKNYDLWEKAVRTALRAKNKLGFIKGTLVRPAAKVTYKRGLCGYCKIDVGDVKETICSC